MTATEAWEIISACDLTDCGPPDEGYRSDELSEAVMIVEEACRVYDKLIRRRNI